MAARSRDGYRAQLSLVAVCKWVNAIRRYRLSPLCKSDFKSHPTYAQLWAELALKGFDSANARTGGGTRGPPPVVKF